MQLMQTVDFTKPQKSGYLENKTFFFFIKAFFIAKMSSDEG